MPGRQSARQHSRLSASLARWTGLTAGVGCLFVGMVLGWLLFRLRERKKPGFSEPAA